MNARKLWSARLGQWAFGSAMAWACIGPTFGLNQLLRGSFICCTGTSLVCCLGPYPCSTAIACGCYGTDPSGNCDTSATHTCPTYCTPSSATGICSIGGMSPCYY
jgi:hypothetical protein